MVIIVLHCGKEESFIKPNSSTGNTISNRRNKLLRLYPIAIAVLILLIICSALKLVDSKFGRISNPDSTGAGIVTVCSPKEGIENYLFEGIDTFDNDSSSQADTLLLLSVNKLDQTYSVLEINRDTMVNVPVLDLFGNPVSYEYQQIALAHTYHDDSRINAKNVVSAVSAYLGDIPIDGYFAMNIAGIEVLNDSAGGVPVIVESDFSSIDPSLVAGEEVVLTGSQALTYIRARQGVDDQTNASRMIRQRTYLDSLKEVLSGLDQDRLIQIYTDIQPYATTNIEAAKAIDILKDIAGYERISLQIEGENKIENDHYAFYPDLESVNDIVMKNYCEEK